MDPDKIPQKVFSHAEYLESYMSHLEFQVNAEQTIDELNLENISLLQKIDNLIKANQILFDENQKLKSLLN